MQSYRSSSPAAMWDCFLYQETLPARKAGPWLMSGNLNLRRIAPLPDKRGPLFLNCVCQHYDLGWTPASFWECGIWVYARQWVPAWPASKENAGCWVSRKLPYLYSTLTVVQAPEGIQPRTLGNSQLVSSGPHPHVPLPSVVSFTAVSLQAVSSKSPGQCSRLEVVWGLPTHHIASNSKTRVELIHWPAERLWAQGSVY
jgi:hypothetical protein